MPSPQPHLMQGQSLVFLALLPQQVRILDSPKLTIGIKLFSQVWGKEYLTFIQCGVKKNSPPAHHLNATRFQTQPTWAGGLDHNSLSLPVNAI